MTTSYYWAFDKISRDGRRFKSKRTQKSLVQETFDDAGARYLVDKDGVIYAPMDQVEGKVVRRTR